MCTVTIVPLADGFRLMCNRDEQHTRPAAQPPRWVRTRRTDVLMPIDRQGGGSWIAVTGDGFAVTLLNRAADDLPDESQPKHSRGELVMSLVSAGGIDEFFKEISSRATVVMGLKDQFYGMREFGVEDPDGYIILFAQRIG